MVQSSSSRARGFKVASWTSYFIAYFYYISLEVDGLRILPMRMASSAPKSDRNELSKPKREFRTLRGMPCTGQPSHVLCIVFIVWVVKLSRLKLLTIHRYLDEDVTNVAHMITVNNTQWELLPAVFRDATNVMLLNMHQLIHVCQRIA